MNPRERLLAAMAGQEILPIPVGVFCGRIFPKPQADLARHFGLAETDSEGVLAALGAHDRFGEPLYVGPALAAAPFEGEAAFPSTQVTRSIWGTWSGIASYYDGIDRPLKSVETTAEIETYGWPNPDWFDYSRLGRPENLPGAFLPVTQWAHQFSRYARLGGDWSPVFSQIMDLCGMEAGLILLATRPALVQALVARIGDFWAEYYQRLAQATQGHLDCLHFGDDFAGQQGLLLRPAKWREYFLPTWKRLFAIAHQHGLKAWLHSCGAVRPVLGDLIDAGLDVFETLQVRAAGMEPAELKREFGAHLTFYGGVDTQELLPYGTGDETRREVRRLVEMLGRGGRYILSSSHNLLDDVPATNILAMYDEARAFRPDWAAEGTGNHL
jgi:uroporphyrinogen decarboxylase